MQSLNRIGYITVFSAASISIFVIESFFPTPLPGIRIGFANIFILLALIFFGLKESLLIGILKSLIGSLVLAKLFSPTFLFSMSGTLISTLAMWTILKSKLPISLIGISIIGAEVHIITQLLIATSFFLPQVSFFYLSPIYILVSLITGSITGIFSFQVYTKLKRRIKICAN